MRRPFYKFLGYILVLILQTSLCLAQSNKAGAGNSLIYIDKEGVMRWKKDKTEAAFYGVNYTTPFAFAYRAHKTLDVDLEKAIQQDVYHLARLGLDAFRVHVWDTEISDVAGNLLENEHLRLYDFLLAELKKRNIKTIITPIAFWGNGYPERDENTPGFSQFYGRGKLTTNDSAIVAQENYLKQFFKHVNPYTKLSYHDDPDVIAVEINNEPAHSGPKSGVTQYINRLAAAIKSTGWKKPVFYNISQGPYYADAVTASVADGYSFQWYPSGLVSGGTLKGNFLPHVDKYVIPFDTNKAFNKKPLMVYEFDAGDIMQPIMYPAMARSFRQAGFQWATQFAYDPMAIAHVNTEYQTHYLNLAYTPGKAISMLIASKVFHRAPRLKNFGVYPADSVFDVFRLSYKESLSEMNTEQEFYYSNSTGTKPVSMAKLQHIAGVGNSILIQYSGTGAYFLDKLEEGVWRLEVMPDAIHIRDPFEKSSPKKEVTRIQWRSNQIQILLPELGNSFSIKAVNEGNSFSTTASANRFQVSPGTYLIEGNGKKFSGKVTNIGGVNINEFVAPKSSADEMYVRHDPFPEVSAGRAFTIRATIVGLDSDNATLQINKWWGQYKTIPMVRKSAYEYTAEVPADLVTPGQLQYRIILRKDNDFSVFPGNFKGDPYAWDNFQYESWKTFVAYEQSALELFNANVDRPTGTFPVWRRGFQTSYITSENPSQMVLRMSTAELGDVKGMGFQFSCVDKKKGRTPDMDLLKMLVLRARTIGSTPLKAKIVLTFADASSVSAEATLKDAFQDIQIPLDRFVPDAALLMPRPYPDFQPLFFKGAHLSGKFRLSDLEKIEIMIGSDLPGEERKKSYTLDIESIWLQRE